MEYQNNAFKPSSFNMQEVQTHDKSESTEAEDETWVPKKFIKQY